MSKNVFIAIGGSGAKVAEALVRLLAIGFPTHKEQGVLTSVEDTLQIWRVDPDLSAGAAAALNNAIKDYQELQKRLSDGKTPNNIATSRWAMDIDVRVRELNPLDLPRATEADNQEKTLRGILDSRYGDKQRSAPFLDPFYEPKDLEVKIDRGFYQKPFIGAAVMAVYSDSLKEDSTPGGREAGLTAFYNNQANFFLCGSLHGGTGACGVPIIGKFLGERKKKNPNWGWRIGGSLLAPYCIPPDPPFKALDEGEASDISDSVLDGYVDRYGNEPAFSELKQKEERRELVKQILRGFFADPLDMEARARQGLSYYKDHSADYFDELYLVGKPEPDKLKVWSNGGQSQRNPLNSAEVVAAIAALNFFSEANASNPQSYWVGASTEDLNSKKMKLYQLPTFGISRATNKVEIDPEKVFLATATLHHLLLQQIAWDKKAKEWTNLKGLKNYYMGNELKKEEDKGHFDAAMSLIANSMVSLVDDREEIAVGWSGQDKSELLPFLSSLESDVKEITKQVSTGWWGDDPRGSLDLGRSRINVSTKQFGKWCPANTAFTRGEYLRFVWSNLYERIQDKDDSA